MKLYFSPGACSLSPHIVLREMGADFSLEQVDTKAKTVVSTGENYLNVNLKGAVPCLALDNDEVLTEGAIIIQYLVDQDSSCDLIPPLGGIDRYRTLEWLNYIGSDLHKGFGQIFNPKGNEGSAAVARNILAPRLEYVGAHLAERSNLLGEEFSAPDAYLFTILNWAAPAKVDLSPWPALGAYLERVAARPAVQAALQAEGLV